MGRQRKSAGSPPSQRGDGQAACFGALTSLHHSPPLQVLVGVFAFHGSHLRLIVRPRFLSDE
jgi:hypothetical protein